MQQMTTSLCSVVLLPLLLFSPDSSARLCSKEYEELQKPIGNVSQYKKVPVRTNAGDVHGFELVNHSGRKGNVFLGIPYAELPVQKLRFEHPVPKKAWKGVIHTFDWKPDCVQRPSNGASEDCLYLNVIAPVEKPGIRYPVICYFFGGVFNFGTPSSIKPRFVVEDLLPEGVILVIPNYRLNIFGFWTTGNEVAPGNIQLFDMRQALQWIHDEIHHFGGDCSRVTIMGYSSGAASVQLLSLSPLTEHLYHQAIVMSGQGFAATIVSNDVSRFRTAATTLGCNADDKWSQGKFEEIKSCMQNVDADDAVKAYMDIIERNSYFTINSQSRVDGPGGILPLHLPELVKRRRAVNYLIGTTSNEKVTYLRSVPQPTREQIEKHCAMASETYGNSNFTEVCTHFYNVEVRAQWDADPDFVDQPLKKIDSGQFYYATAFADAAAMRDNGGTVFLYSFDYIKPGFEQTGPSHADDLFWLFGIERTKFMLTSCATEFDDEFRKRYTRMFANFVKTGNPTPLLSNDSVVGHWEPLQAPTGFKYMSIDREWTMKEFYNFHAVKLWDEIFPFFNKTFKN